MRIIKFKRLLTIFLATALFLSMFAGFASGQAETTGETKAVTPFIETITEPEEAETKQEEAETESGESETESGESETEPGESETEPEESETEPEESEKEPEESEKEPEESEEQPEETLPEEIPALVTAAAVPIVPAAVPIVPAATALVPYLDENGLSQSITATKIESDTNPLTLDATTTGGWYYVDGTALLQPIAGSTETAIDIDGDVKIILTNDSHLQAFGDHAGINLSTGGSTLTIYAQSTGANMGKLTATVGDINFAGIACEIGDTLNIYGGEVTATGNYRGAGIGGGFTSDCGTVNIYGGKVTATGGGLAAGIGGGDQSDGGTVNIYGGTVIAKGGGGAGIGGGSQGYGGTVNISGGTVTATGDGGSGAGIGGGSGVSGGGSGGTVNISGGTVVADGNNMGSDIGGGQNGTGDGTLIISGGSVNPINGNYPQPTDGTNPVYQNTLTLGHPAVSGEPQVTAGSVDGTSLNLNDVKTDSAGKIYLWLPEDLNPSAILVETAGKTYIAQYVRNAVNKVKTLVNANLMITGDEDVLLYEFIPFLFTVATDVQDNVGLYFWVERDGVVGSLPDGLHLADGSGTDPYTPGTIYGAPLDYEPFKDGVTFMVYARNIADLDEVVIAWAVFTIKLAPTPSNAELEQSINDYPFIEDATTGDDGRIEDIITGDRSSYATNQILHIDAPFALFDSFWINGIKQTPLVQYNAEDGSTTITVLAQTIRNLDNGTHTAAAAFRTADGAPNSSNSEFDVVAQSFTVNLTDNGGTDPEDTNPEDTNPEDTNPNNTDSGNGGNRSDRSYGRDRGNTVVPANLAAPEAPTASEPAASSEPAAGSEPVVPPVPAANPTAIAGLAVISGPLDTAEPESEEESGSQAESEAESEPESTEESESSDPGAEGNTGALLGGFEIDEDGMPFFNYDGVSPLEPRIDRPFEDFEGMRFDGGLWTPGIDYTARSGSTILSIPAERLEGIAAGLHTISADFKGGEAVNISFNLNKIAADTPDEAKTGPAPIIIILAVLLAGGASAAVIVKKRAAIAKREDEV